MNPSIQSLLSFLAKEHDSLVGLGISFIAIDIVNRRIIFYDSHLSRINVSQDFSNKTHEKLPE